MKTNKQKQSIQQGASNKMKPSKRKHKSAPQGASNKVTNVVAAGDGRDKNALTTPPRKSRRRMQNRIWKRLREAVDLNPYFETLRAAVDHMLNDVERGNNGKVSLTESDLFSSDGSLTNLGYNYVEEAYESIGDLLDWSDTLTGLAAVLDKECFTFFMIERARKKRVTE